MPLCNLIDKIVIATLSTMQLPFKFNWLFTTFSFDIRNVAFGDNINCRTKYRFSPHVM